MHGTSRSSSLHARSRTRAAGRTTARAFRTTGRRTRDRRPALDGAQCTVQSYSIQPTALRPTVLTPL
eukprot:scaffold7632_cov135-Isochrysis_galbana.AAC.1